MAFGLTQWLISFAIFLIVLTIITWSAVHLGRKDQNSTDIITRFLDMDNYSTKREKYVLPFYLHISHLFSKSLHSTSLLPNASALFTNDQGSEIPDSAQFYEIFRAFYSTEGSTVNSSNYDTVTATSASSIVENDSMWIDDTTITPYNTSTDNKTFILDDRQNVSGKVIILPDHISQTARSALTHNAKLFDVNELWKDLSQSAGTKLSEFFRDAKNETLDTFTAFSFTRGLFDAKQLNMTERAKTVREIGGLETSTKTLIK
ncbi:uncharacterized protein LOC143903045 [Temnothorax americanus]|uniref:uncharacterized protein LOC143903045 n=1 Tax=Temnothorax americanus TaxID=1964332 RepID=UPI0040685EFB